MRLPREGSRLRPLKPYSNDLRGKIVAASESTGYSQRAVAALVGGSPATARTLVRRTRGTGSAGAWPHSGGKVAALNDKARAFVCAAAQQTPDPTLEGLVGRGERKHGKEVARSTMCRVLQALGVPREKSRSTPRSETPPESSTPAASTGRGWGSSR